MSPWIIVLVIAIAIAGMVLAYLHEQKRREALGAIAAELGWSFDPSRDTRHDDEYAHFEAFRRGHSRAAFNTLTGAIEIDGRRYPSKMGDFRYKVTHHSSKGSRTQTYRFSYLILHLPYPSVPNLVIRREGLFDKLAGALGFDDIDFESEEFSRAFHVKGPDKRFAYDVIHPRMMQFLLDTNPPAIDIEHGRCLVMDGKRRWRPDEFHPRLQWCRRFFEAWPEHLTTQLDG